MIYKDIKYIFYDYDDAKNFVDNNIVTLERWNVTAAEKSQKKKWKLAPTSSSDS